MSQSNCKITSDNPNRFTLFPIADNDIWKMYKNQVDCFWRAEEVDLTKDKKDWEKLSENEKHFIKLIHIFYNDFFQMAWKHPRKKNSQTRIQ